jgi:hypothetical protein
MASVSTDCLCMYVHALFYFLKEINHIEKRLIVMSWWTIASGVLLLLHGKLAMGDA